MRNLTSRPGKKNPWVCLDHDGVAELCDCRRFATDGAVFDAPCGLELMSELTVSIKWGSCGCGLRTLRLSAVVVGCSKNGDGGYEITVVFFSADERAGNAFRHLPN